MLKPQSVLAEDLWIYSLALFLYGLYFLTYIPLDYTHCVLCDAHEYTKVYNYFENGVISQTKFPFYSRPLIPWLVSLIPGQSIHTHFNFINFIFLILSIWSIRQLWKELQLKFWIQMIGFGWLLIHWTGIIRYNLYDNITVDVPLYFFQSVALLVFLRKDYKWFFVLVPVALLQKESFLAIMLVFILIHFLFDFKNQPWHKGKLLVLTTIVGIIIQKSILYLLPEQSDQRSSLDAILYHGHLAFEDPTRFIRWFAAFGSAFGVLPFVLLFKFNLKRFTQSHEMILLTLSLLYCCFGLLAGEDMTRILFLGFPFIMTYSLTQLQSAHRVYLISAIGLSLISLRFIPIPIDKRWAVDYADLSYVWSWSAYYFLAVLALFLVYRHIRSIR